MAAIALSPGAIAVFQPSGFVLSSPNPTESTQPSSHPISRPIAQQVIAQQSRVRRIRFDPGTSAVTIQDAVIRGTRDIYLLGASKGQTMTVKIVSIENNASFAITAPANQSGLRRTLIPDAVNWSGTLPTSGDYRVIVGGTRGNASYKIQVSIR